MGFCTPGRGGGGGGGGADSVFPASLPRSEGTYLRNQFPAEEQPAERRKLLCHGAQKRKRRCFPVRRPEGYSRHSSSRPARDPSVYRIEQPLHEQLPPRRPVQQR